jgi:hypothetical protein
MSKNALATVILCAGFLLVGFAVGRFLSPTPAPIAANPDEGLPPFVVPKLSPYEAPAPRTQLERPREPRGPEGAASSPETANSVMGILADPDPIQRAIRLGTYLENLGPEGLDEVRGALKDLSVDHDGVSITLLLAFWSNLDPSGASWYAMRTVPQGFSATAARTAVTAFARRDPKKALDQVAANTLVPRGSPAVMEQALVRGWFESGQPGLVEYIAALGQAEGMQRALNELVRCALRRDGPEGIVRWIEDLPDEYRAFKLAAFRQAALALTTVDPTVGVAFCEAHCDGPYGEGLRALVARRYGAWDGPAAMAWVATAEPGAERDRAVIAAFEGWFASEDRPGLVKWYQAKGPEKAEPWLQPTFDLFATVQAAMAPEEALAWAQAVQDPQRREGAILNVLRTWRHVDPQAADAWIDQSPLDEDMRERARMYTRQGLTRQQLPHENPAP